LPGEGRSVLAPPVAGDVAAGDWFARPHPVQALRAAPEAAPVRIEVNGRLAGVAPCLAEATREFAVGWAFLHRFFTDAADVATVNGAAGRIAIMLDNGVDVDRLRREAVGWDASTDGLWSDGPVSGRAPRAVPVVSQHDLMTLIERAFARFEAEGRMSGLCFAALAEGNDLVVIARDVATTGAIAKLLGWRALERRNEGDQILIVSGLVEEIAIDGANRAGIGIVASDGEATAGAIRLARLRGTTVLGTVMTHQRAFRHDGGHVGNDGEPGHTWPLPHGRRFGHATLRESAR
jgi:formate dehydrogenase accessory protein FdhD